MSELSTLVLVCKRPKLGIGKQRLAVDLGAEVTQQVAEALLDCAIEDAANWPGPIVIAPANQVDHDWALALSSTVQSSVIVLPQISGNLGQRLNKLDHVLREKGMKQLVYIGSDAPGLEEADYLAVNDALHVHDVVLIPAIDGGVVLMASQYPWPELSELPWSTNQLGAMLAESCRTAGHSIMTLRQGSDVDDLGDFVKLKTQLAQDQRPARRILHELVCHIVSVLKISHA